jgi:ADP-heptose:LPS heptosyltransferase
VIVHPTPGLRALLDAVPLLRAARRAHPDEELVLVGPSWLAGLARQTGVVDAVVGEAPALARDAAELDLAVDAGDHKLLVPELAPPAEADVVVHPGASSPDRAWPASRWAIVAEQEHDAGRRVVVTGTAAEEDLAWQVAGLGGLGRRAMLTGRTDLVELLALLVGADRVLTGDTGVARMAWAVGTPTLVVAGGAAPTPPPGPHVVVAGESLHSIGPDAVLDALATLPTPRGRAGCP